jgi:hypothetical protein
LRIFAAQTRFSSWLADSGRWAEFCRLRARGGRCAALHFSDGAKTDALFEQMAEDRAKLWTAREGANAINTLTHTTPG